MRLLRRSVIWMASQMSITMGGATRLGHLDSCFLCCKAHDSCDSCMHAAVSWPVGVIVWPALTSLRQTCFKRGCPGLPLPMQHPISALALTHRDYLFVAHRSSAALASM